MFDLQASLNQGKKRYRSNSVNSFRPHRGYGQDTDGKSGDGTATGAETGKRFRAGASVGRAVRTVRRNCREHVSREKEVNRLDLRSSRSDIVLTVIVGIVVFTCQLVESYLRAVRRCATCAMGMMGMFKWLRKDIIQRERNGWNLAQKQCGLNNESYRNALQAFIDRRRLSDDVAHEADTASSPDKKRADLLAKNNNNKWEKECKLQESKSMIPGVPHIRASEIFEIGWVAGTEDRYLELIFAEWQNTRISLKRHTHPDCKDAVKRDLDVLSDIRHPNVLLLMATTQTDDHGLVSIFESVDCTLYNYIHEQGERISIQGIAKCGGRLSDALRHAHMRGYVHGAISSHCVYLASSGIVKLGGWELAVQINNPKPDREYEERLRTEIFRWQAPELFYGSEPQKESDVYGLTLLIWEMSTMRVPWSGCSRADVERQYVQWKRGVLMDLYDFPPLLNNLLEAGLQLDITKRTLDMNRMRRFLQRLEMQYEDEDPVYIDQYANNNNESAKTYIVPIVRSPSNASKTKSSRLTKSVSAKQLSHSPRPTESPSKQYLYSKKGTPKKSEISKATAHAEQINLFADDIKHNTKDELQKKSNILCNIQKNHKNIIYPSSKLEDTDGDQNEESNLCSSVQPWNTTYRKVKVPKEMITSRSMTTSVGSNSSPVLESSDDESYKDARSNLKQLKEVLANKREHFFYGSDSSHISGDTSPRTRNEIFTQARSKDYEPHKPASHKTSLEPKYNKSPGQYNPSYTKPSFKQSHKMPYLHTPKCIRPAVLQPQTLNSDTQSFFETSLWRKEKLICISKMRKFYDDEPIYAFVQDADNDTIDSRVTTNQLGESGSPKCDYTYVINSKSEGNDTESSREGLLHTSGNISDSTETVNSQSKSLQVLKEALDRATKIVRSVTPNSDESSSPPFKTYQNFEVTVDDAQIRKSIFEDLYDIQTSNQNEEIKSIERSSSGNETFLLNKSKHDDTSSSNETQKEYGRITLMSYEKPSQSYNTTYTRSFVCESIAEVSSELSTSYNETKTNNTMKSYSDKENNVEEKEKSEKPETQIQTNINEKKSIVTNLTLMLLNDTAKIKNCNSCHQSALPRRRSLPAALNQSGAINNSALGKLPIRKGDVPDSTVEDIYIDDEFGGSLNVNMVLLDDDLSLDEDFLPDISEL